MTMTAQCCQERPAAQGTCDSFFSFPLSLSLSLSLVVGGWIVWKVVGVR